MEGAAVPSPEGATQARDAALLVLEMTGRGRRLDLALDEVAAGLAPGERQWVQEVTYGTVRMRGRIDFLLDLHLRRGLASLPRPVVWVLRMGAYQLLLMSGTPAYAAVSQSVEQTRAVGAPGLAGVVNGVLRSLAREGGGRARFPSFESDPVAHLTHWGSHPRWLVERWVARYGATGTLALVRANNKVPRTWIRPLDGDPAATIAALAAAGIEAAPGPEGSGTVKLPVGVHAPEAFGAVRAIVQDPAAGWVVAWCGEVQGRRLMDLCAAPGGKSIALVARGARVTAADVSDVRLRLVRESAERLGMRMSTVVARAEAPPFAPAEVVLVDAPCSGTGTLARHPDARWRLHERDIRRLAALQERILEGAAACVGPGGLLVYSTCTLEPEENEDRVEAFLRGRGEFIVEGGDGVPDAVRDGEFLRVLPQRMRTDGSFAVRFRRIKG